MNLWVTGRVKPRLHQPIHSTTPNVADRFRISLPRERVEDLKVALKYTRLDDGRYANCAVLSDAQKADRLTLVGLDPRSIGLLGNRAKHSSRSARSGSRWHCRRSESHGLRTDTAPQSEGKADRSSILRLVPPRLRTIHRVRVGRSTGSVALTIRQRGRCSRSNPVCVQTCAAHDTGLW